MFTPTIVLLLAAYSVNITVTDPKPFNHEGCAGRLAELQTQAAKLVPQAEVISATCKPKK